MNQKISSIRADVGESVSYMMDEIAHICRRFGPRDPGSAGERAAAEYMSEKLKSDCGCGEVRMETFRAHPSAFYGYFRISALLDVLSCAAFFLHPALGAAMGLLAMALFVFQFVLYRQIIDGFFPAKTSVNLTALRPSSGEVKRRVFFNGHVDAAWEFPLNHYFGGVVFEIPGLMCVIGVLYYIVISVCALCGGGAWTESLGLWGLLFLPFFVLQAFTYNPRRVVDGANDDLSGCYMGMALLRDLEKNQIVLENTEVGVIITGSEEAGLRGAKAWCQRHKDDYRDVPSYIISYDTIHDPRQLMVNRRDLNGTLLSDGRLAEGFLRAAREAGSLCKNGWVPPLGGATDSAAFTQGGFQSVGITGLNHKLEKYYHTRADSFDNLNPQGLENCYRATLRLLELMDAGAFD